MSHSLSASTFPSIAGNPVGKVVGIGGGSWPHLGQEQVTSSEVSTEAVVVEGAMAAAGKSC